MAKVSNPYNLNGIDKDYKSYSDIEKYNYDGIYGPIPDENGLVDLSNYAENYIPNYQSVTEIPLLNQKYLDSGIKPTSLYDAFDRCYEIKKINLTKFSSTEYLTNIAGCFGQVRNYGTMGGNLEEINIYNWDTSNVTRMSNLFSGCRKLKKIIIDALDLSSCTNVNFMFSWYAEDIPVYLHLKNVPRSLDLSNISGTEGKTYIIDNYID